jgi:hypothetical protein
VPEDPLDRIFGELAHARVPVPSAASVLARGRQRRRRARVQAGAAAAAAVALVAIIAVGAIQLPGAGPRPSAEGHGQRPAAVCTAAPDAALSLALRHYLPGGGQAGVSPIALSPDSADLYLETTDHGFHGIAEENVATGAILVTIKALPAGDTSARGGIGPDGDLLWSASYRVPGRESAGTTPVQLWSPRTGTTSTLEPAGLHGGAVSDLVFYGTDHQYAAWLQQSGRSQEVVEADLLTGATAVVASGAVGPPVFVGNSLVWPSAADAAGPATQLIAMNAATFPARLRVPVPASLRAVRQGALMGSSSEGSWSTPVGLISSYGGQTAYYSPDLTRLYYSPSPSQPARLVLIAQSDANFGAGPPVLGTGYLGWTTDSAASSVASTTTLAAAVITNGNTTYGGVQGMGYDVLADISELGNKQDRDRLSLLSGSVIAGLTCQRQAKPGRK